MLKPKQMSKVLLAGHKDVLEPTIETLHDLHALHIEEYVGEDYFHIGTPLPGAEDDSKKLLKLRSIASFLGIKKSYPEPINARQLSSELEGKLETLGGVVSRKLERKSQIETDLKDVQTGMNEIEAFSGVPVNFELCSGYETLHVFAGTVKKGADVRAGLKGITDEYQFFAGNTGLFILAVPVKHMEQVTDLLAEYEFGEVKIPAISGTPDDLISELKSRQDSLTKDIESLSSEIDSVKAEYEEFILASEEVHPCERGIVIHRDAEEGGTTGLCDIRACIRDRWMDSG